MQIEVRSLDRMQGKNAYELAPVLGALSEAVKGCKVDPARLRVVCDWMQYRHNFRDAVQVRTIQPSALEAARPMRGAKASTNGHDAYEIMLGDCYWHIYQMLGKFSYRIYVARG